MVERKPWTQGTASGSIFEAGDSGDGGEEEEEEEEEE